MEGTPSLPSVPGHLGREDPDWVQALYRSSRMIEDFVMGLDRLLYLYQRRQAVRDSDYAVFGPGSDELESLNHEIRDEEEAVIDALENLLRLLV